MHTCSPSQGLKNILTFMFLTDECRQQKQTQHAPSTKTECDYITSMVGLNTNQNKTKKVTYTKISSKMVNPKDGAGKAEEENGGLPLLLAGYLTPQQHASECQRRICSDNCACCHTEREVADQTCYLTQSQHTDTGPASPSYDPQLLGALQGSH